MHHEPLVKGEHQSNGAAESTLQQLRLKAGILMNQIEDAVAGGRLIVLSCMQVQLHTTPFF